MKKIFSYIIPVILIAFFILIMLSAPLLKQSYGEKDNVLGIIKTIEYDIDNDKWKSAEKNIDKLDDAWKIVSKRVQFSAEWDELINAESCIARARGYVKANYKAGVLSELSEVKEHWHDIGK
ncbi:DUF4363 family protein [Anaerovorax odorimutans]|uniref:DUF4363 family protein n=1 Tax=Anaerovorax odorimutans TaxID=109327 RepID=UPI0004252878|nr:DUF4363 family protein [Anaerovorax odorimutans]